MTTPTVLIEADPEASQANSATEAVPTERKVTRGPTKVAKGVRSTAKPARAKAAGKASKAEPAKVLAYTKPFVNDRGLKLPAGKGVEWVQEVVGNKRVAWATGQSVEWPEAARETGKAVEAQLRKAGKAGLTWDEIQGSVNRLGYLIRKGKVDLLPAKGKPAKASS
jgi:hypothetical protein